ncbi:hypothetical protein OAO87_02405 [bacterium]|nr:hypothetical protein [bacterium]
MEVPSSELRKAFVVYLFVTKTAFFGRFLRFLRFPFFSDALFTPSGFVVFPPSCSQSERFSSATTDDRPTTHNGGQEKS